MSFPWHLGSAPAPIQRRVKSGAGSSDPHAQFLAHRSTEQARQATAVALQGKTRLNARAAWEDAAEQRMETARSAREDAGRRLAAAQRKAARHERMQALYRGEWDGWVSALEARKWGAARPNLDTLRSQAASLQTAREEERQRTAREALDRRALAGADTLRPYAAQARLEAVVRAWEGDRAAREGEDARAAEAEEAFTARWTPRTPALSAPDPALEGERRAAAARAAADLRDGWERNRADRALAAEAEAARDRAFVRRWVGMDQDPALTEDNMYIWRDPAAGSDGEAGGAEEAVEATLALDLDFDATCGNPAAAEAFKAAFVADMAALLGVDPASLYVSGLEAGSVKVTFTIAAVSGGPSPADLIADLATAVAAGGVTVAGGGAKGIENTTPSAEKRALHNQKMAQRRAHRRF